MLELGAFDPSRGTAGKKRSRRFPALFQSLPEFDLDPLQPQVGDKIPAVIIFDQRVIIAGIKGDREVCRDRPWSSRPNENVEGLPLLLID